MIDNPAEQRAEWFALRVKSRHENVVAAMARSKGYEEFAPFWRSRRRWSDRDKSVDVPLFPGYVFCRFRRDDRLPLLTIPGVVHVVGIGKVPVPIEDSEIAAIQTAVSSGLAFEPQPFLEVGDRVRVEKGALAGVEGILVELRKNHRLVVSITLLKRSVAVDIEGDWITPVEKRGANRMLPPSAPAECAVRL
jgi:transcription antitermination factor NusG